MNSVTCTSGFPCRATMNRKAGSVTPSMGESPTIGCGMSCQKLTGRDGNTATDKNRGDEPAARPLLLLARLLLGNQNVAAAKCAPFCRAAVHGNGERVCRARLAVIRHIDGKGAWRTIHGAGAAERGCIANDHQGSDRLASNLRARRVVEVLELAA